MNRICSFALAALAIGQAWTAPLRARNVSSPANDPFYQPPSGFQSTAPGTVLKSRTVQTSFFGLVPNPVQGYQLLYRTTAINGSAIATVTTVFVPSNAATDRFVSFQTAYDSSSINCDPSYTYQEGATQTDLITSVEALLLEGFLIEGLIVSSSDYEGPDAAFGAGHLEGMAVLDSMRAVENFGSTLGLKKNPMVVGYGYSGGSIATGWAASLQPTYASELNMKGWAQGGTPANLTGTFLYLNGNLFSGFLAPALDGLLKPSAYGEELQPLFNQILTSAGQKVLNEANNNCAVDDILNFASQSLLSTQYQTMGQALITNPTLAGVLDQNIMGLHANQTPTAPVYLYHAQADEIIPYNDVTTLYDSWCSQGASVHFTTFANGGHVTTEGLGLPGALAFTNSAFAGTVASGCSQSTVLNSTLNPIAAGAALEPILSKIADAIVKAGENDKYIIEDLEILLDFESTS